jgi:hypothetical protein
MHSLPAQHHGVNNIAYIPECLPLFGISRFPVGAPLEMPGLAADVPVGAEGAWAGAAAGRGGDRNRYQAATIT